MSGYMGLNKPQTKWQSFHIPPQHPATNHGKAVRWYVQKRHLWQLHRFVATAPALRCRDSTGPGLGDCWRAGELQYVFALAFLLLVCAEEVRLKGLTPRQWATLLLQAEVVCGSLQSWVRCCSQPVSLLSVPHGPSLCLGDRRRAGGHLAMLLALFVISAACPSVTAGSHTRFGREIIL